MYNILSIIANLLAPVLAISGIFINTKQSLIREENVNKTPWTNELVLTMRRQTIFINIGQLMLIAGLSLILLIEKKIQYTTLIQLVILTISILLLLKAQLNTFDKVFNNHRLDENAYAIAYEKMNDQIIVNLDKPKMITTYTIWRIANDFAFIIIALWLLINNIL